MAQQPRIVREAFEAPRRVDVAGALGNVDVDADVIVLGKGGSGSERVIGACERCVDTDETNAPVGEEPSILLETPTCSVGPMAVRHPVCGDDAHADFGAGIGDDGE